LCNRGFVGNGSVCELATTTTTSAVPTTLVPGATTDSSNSNTIIAILAAFTGLLLFIAMIVLLYRCRRRQQRVATAAARNTQSLAVARVEGADELYKLPELRLHEVTHDSSPSIINGSDAFQGEYESVT
jgi:hypothetical protein